MTTESKQVPRIGGSLLLGAAVFALLLGVLMVVLGALLGGSAAAYGALTGTLLAVVVLGLGTFTVDAVAGLMPSASLLVALLTYVLQVVLLAVAFGVLTSSGLLDDTLDRRWLAAAVIVGVLAWLVAQIRLTTKARIPVYDLTKASAR